MNERSDPLSSALDTALSILGERPGVNPDVEVRVIEPDAEIADERYLVVVFGNCGLLVDKVANWTRTISLDVPNGPPEKRDQSLIAKATEVARMYHLPTVYLSRRVDG